MTDGYFDSIAREASKVSAKAMDDHILKFFGTRENAEKNAHLYIMDHCIQTKTHLNGSMRLDVWYKIRKKTKEELEND